MGGTGSRLRVFCQGTTIDTENHSFLLSLDSGMAPFNTPILANICKVSNCHTKSRKSQLQQTQNRKKVCTFPKNSIYVFPE